MCVCVHGLIFCFVHRRCVSRHQPQSPQEYTLPSYYGKLILINHSQSREMFVKKLFRLRIWSPRYKYENIFNTQHPKPSTPENVNVKEKTVKTTTVTDVRIGVMNVQSLGNKLDCVIDHITDNRIDIVGITETWLSNDDKNNMSVVNTCLNNGYTLLHRPRNTGRRGGGVGVLINNQINVKSRMIDVNPEITSFESMEVVITAGSITIRLSVIYRMPPVKSKNGLKQGTFCNE